MTDFYYVVMCKPLSRDPNNDRYEEYTGRHWRLDQELEAHEELWDAQHDGEVEEAYIKEVCPW